MENIRQPVFYARSACDTMMRKFKAEDLPPKGHFHYHQGVFLSGVQKTYEICGDERYFSYMRDWVDSIIDADGELHWFDPTQFDDMQPGILLYPLLDKTGDQRYKKALDTLIEAAVKMPKNEAGGFWHKVIHPNQMWLDGLYMAGPLCAEYADRFEQPVLIELSINQALLMREKTEDKNTGLWYHAWDSSKQQAWADPVTGLSPEFWGRSIGWVPVAVLDELDFIPTSNQRRVHMQELVRDLLTAVCNYQSDDGRWYQVTDKGGQSGNWLENSCSCLFAAAICKAVRNDIFPESYLSHARKAYEGVIRSLTWEDDDLLIGGVCVGTGVGDYKHYCERPVSVNDLHGVGAFLLMCAEMQNFW